LEYLKVLKLQKVITQHKPKVLNFKFHQRLKEIQKKLRNKKTKKSKDIKLCQSKIKIIYEKEVH